jgi:hypothetical protein
MEYESRPVYIDHWPTAPSLSTYGKREKDVRIEPSTGQLYFYKHSDKRYPWDFWCEVIASKLGQLLGLDIATYEPAYSKVTEDKYVWGCFSPLLHDPSKGEEFVHGQSYLQFLEPGFDTDRGTDHNYELIRKALVIAVAKEPDLEKFHEMLVFDALICNRDRHQENWAIIRSAGIHPSPVIRDHPIVKEGVDTNWLKQLVDEVRRMLSARLAPIYDSGTSLGHNLLEEAMKEMLLPEGMYKLVRFATGPKATAHIRFKGERLRHDVLLVEISKKHPKLVANALDKVLGKFDKAAIEKLLDVVDAPVMREADRMQREFHQELIPPAYVLTSTRKAFIRELLYLRHQELCKLREQIRA